ncbi:hypothetical protein B0H34DRAFT_802505 [Crassisporium funariophilum]|nr:hypothetical protein B0H34DRAFT_802505 [Crassisporium funariophilum]
MTNDKEKQAVGGQRPCTLCSGTAEALHILAMALQTAQDGNSRSYSLAHPQRAVPQADLPQQLQDMCARMGYLVLEEDPIRVPDPVDQDIHGDIIPPAAVTTTSAQPEADSPADDRWYAVISGRNPGVHRGSQNLAGNATGVPGGFAQRYATQAKAQAAYDEALALGRVYKITFNAGRD